MADQGGAGLEDQLRNMILSNVSVSGVQRNTEMITGGPHQQHFQQGRSRGRGRGRGGIFRGRGARNHDGQVGRGQPSLRNATSDTSAVGERGNVVPGEYDPQHTTHSTTANGHQPAQASPNWRPPRSIANQPFTQDGSYQYGPTPAPQPWVVHRVNLPTAPSKPPPPRAAYRNAQPSRQYIPPGQPSPDQVPEDPSVQVSYLDHLASQEVPKAQISPAELEEKQAFSTELEGIFQKAFAKNYTGKDIAEIKLVGFGSLASGFAIPGSDLDLAVVPGWTDSTKAEHTIEINRDIPRLLERAVLDAKMGGRLLTRTRVPILKVCQLPTEALATALLEERQKWDDLSEDEKYAELVQPPEIPSQALPGLNLSEFPSLSSSGPQSKKIHQQKPVSRNRNKNEEIKSPTTPSTPVTRNADGDAMKDGMSGDAKAQQPRKDRTFRREKTLGPLDFPKEGVGIQCDINFENPLGIHNTRLLRCYSLCDPRVQPIVLFVKAWAKRRKINSSYAGTLSSYGWVLMVIHYLVNIAKPPVCPNLQNAWMPPAGIDHQTLQTWSRETMIAGYAVRFFNNEQEIIQMAQDGKLTTNNQSIGALLRGFFLYYASVPRPYGYGMGPRPPSFHWTHEVLSLRGAVTKSSKGWTGAKTTISNGKEVRQRYLFCIEDPFEYDHNVARTVTHFGIVAIRDEFRRVWRILGAVGRGQQPEGGIFDEIVDQAPPPTPGQAVVETVDPAAVEVDDDHVDGVAAAA